MKYIEAIKEMKKGKKVKRKAHFDDFSYGIVNGIMYEYKNNVRRCTYICHIDSILANDWEVVEEKKTLWDKKQTTSAHEYLNPEDVKEALKEFYDELHARIPTRCLEDYDEIFLKILGDD